MAAMTEIVTSLTNIQTSRYTCGAAMTLMFYDFCLTLSDEIEFIWSGPQKVSSAKLMFLWNRYGTMPWIILANYHLAGLRPGLTNSVRVNVGVLHVCSPVPINSCQNSPCSSWLRLTWSLNSCKFVIVSVAIIQGFSIMVGIQLLALRVLALYKNSRKVRIALFSWLAACHITLTTLVFLSMSRFVPFLIYLPGTNSCYSVPDKLIGYIYIAPILAEAGILFLQIFHHVQRSRLDGSFQTTLITTLYRDGYLYFAAVLSLRFFSVFVYAFAPTSLWYLVNQADFPISTALVSRFFLQLRSAISPNGPESVIMPTGGRHEYKPHGIHSTSFGLPIQSVPEEAYDSVNENYLQPVQLKHLRRLRTTPL